MRNAVPSVAVRSELGKSVVRSPRSAARRRGRREPEDARQAAGRACRRRSANEGPEEATRTVAVVTPLCFSSFPPFALSLSKRSFPKLLRKRRGLRSPFWPRTAPIVFPTRCGVPHIRVGRRLRTLTCPKSSRQVERQRPCRHRITPHTTTPLIITANATQAAFCDWAYVMLE